MMTWHCEVADRRFLFQGRGQMILIAAEHITLLMTFINYTNVIHMPKYYPAKCPVAIPFDSFRLNFYF